MAITDSPVSESNGPENADSSAERTTIDAEAVVSGDGPVTLAELGLDGSYDEPTMLYTASKLGAHDCLDGEDVLISAGTAWRNPGDGFSIGIPEADTLFVDSGGYQSVKYWDGEYPYSAKELFDFAESVDADYVAGMDLMCPTIDTVVEMFDRDRDEVATIPERIEQTIENQIEQYEVYQQHDYDFDLVPVIQGYTPEDYRYCAHKLKRAGLPLEFVTVGSTGKRDQYNQEKTARILEACHDELPRSDFHLLGAGKSHWQNPRLWGMFKTGDTHGWATTMPEGGFPANKAEEEVAYHAYNEALQEACDRMEQHDRSDAPEIDSPLHLTLYLADEWDQECACGVELPTYGDDFEPQCRHCERVQLNRWDKLQARSEELEPPTPQSTQTDLSAF